MKFYCTTDGYIDQNGGQYDYPLGKKIFKDLIRKNYKLKMEEQKNIFINELNNYQNMIKNNQRTDDITLIGFSIS